MPVTSPSAGRSRSGRVRRAAATRWRAALAVAAVAVALAAGPAAPVRPAPSQAGGYVVDAVWPVDGEPLGVAVRPDGVTWTAVLPPRPAPPFATLVRRDAAGAMTANVPVRGTGGELLSPLAVAATAGGDVYAATDRRLLRLDAEGRTLWESAAGDGHADFGPAARGLWLAGDTLYGTDLANARVLGYQAAGGQLRLRLGTAGSGSGGFLAPMDVAVGADGRLFVADFGNRRIQVLDGVGNPLARWALPGRPVAVAVDGAGDVLALLDTDTILVLTPSGTPRLRFGAPGYAPGELRLAADLAVGADGRVYVADRANRRVQVFRPDDGAPDPTAEPTAAPTTPAEPAERRSVSACPGAPARFDWEVALAAAPPRADVLLVFDTTGSMESLISVAQARALDLAAALRTVSPDVAFGLVDVRDYPYGQAGLASDWPWFLRLPLSTDPAALEAAAGEMAAGGGGDAPEAYAGAIARALDDPRVGWRPGARRIVALLGDSVPRDDDLNQNVADPRVASPWTPGRPRWWRDSGPDWAPGSGDDLDWQALLARLRREDVTLVAGISGAAPAELGGQASDLVEYWRAWAAAAGPGGAAADLTSVSRFVGVLEGLVAGSGRRIARLSVGVSPADRAAWVAAAPTEHVDIDVPPGGGRRAFALSVSPPPGTPDGAYPLVVEALGDGGRYGRLEIDVTWRATCEATPTLPGPASATPTATDSPTATATASPSPTASATVPASTTPVPTATATARPTATATSEARRAHLPLVMRGHCFALQRQRADVALVIDTSNSMAGAKLEAARAAALAFLDVVNLPRDRAAVVAFNGRADVVAGLTGSRRVLADALAGLAVDAGTRIDLGLAAAADELVRGPRSRPEATRVIVLVTDGRPDTGTDAAAVRAAGQARAAGVAVFVIGLGADVDAALLTLIAGDRDRYAFAPDASALADIYRRVAVNLPCR